jgi:protein-S-isoprenylcysteine O-methyltransferase Ste14
LSGLSRKPGTGRIIWTVLVTFYFLVLFWNLLGDALSTGSALPQVFAVLFVLWLGVEYYFGSPFFQSGAFGHSAFWRGVFAFFVYPFLGYVAADYIWWHKTQLPIPAAIAGVIGLVVFGLGTFIRLDTLVSLVRIVQYRLVQQSGKEKLFEIVLPEREFTSLRLQRLCRHPRYLATMVQLLGAALAFNSWGGAVLALVLGAPLVWVQALAEDRGMRSSMKSGFDAYRSAVPLLLPRSRS